jgi:hypothetical protein
MIRLPVSDRNSWLLVGIGAVIGLFAGIGAKALTGLLLAPEIGAFLGGCAGIALGRILERRS